MASMKSIRGRGQDQARASKVAGNPSGSGTSADAFARRLSVEEIHALTNRPWFLPRSRRSSTWNEAAAEEVGRWPAENCAHLKRKGFSDRRLAIPAGATETP